MQNLNEAERTMDDYRAADEALDGRLRAAREEIRAAEEAEEPARAEGVAVEHLELRPEFEMLIFCNKCCAEGDDVPIVRNCTLGDAWWELRYQ